MWVQVPLRGQIKFKTMYNKRKVIATTSTIPSRMDNLHFSIKSILGQSIKPDEIVVALPSHSMREEKDYEIHEEIKAMSDSGVITLLHSEEDHGPATKLFPVLKREMEAGLSKDKESIIITFDDDKHYQRNAFENLLSSGAIECGAVACRKGSRIYLASEDHPFYTAKNDGILERIYNGGDEESLTRVDCLYGTSAVAYRASYFDQDVFDYSSVDEDFPEVSAFFVDDIYLSGYLGTKGKTIVVCPFEKTAFQEKAPSNVTDGNTVNNAINPVSDVSKKTPNLSKDVINYFSKVFHNKV